MAVVAAGAAVVAAAAAGVVAAGAAVAADTETVAAGAAPGNAGMVGITSLTFFTMSSATWPALARPFRARMKILRVTNNCAFVYYEKTISKVWCTVF